MCAFICDYTCMWEQQHKGSFPLAYLLQRCINFIFEREGEDGEVGREGKVNCSVCLHTLQLISR